MAAGDGRPQILIVPEQHSHSMERQLCAIGGSRVSLFAEVLSFTRLANRVFSVYGGLAAPALDGGGRLLLLCAALKSVAPELRVYQRPSRKPAFLSGLLATVDELKTCRITPEQLWTAGEESGGGEGDKLRDLSLIYGAYEAMTARQGADPRDRLTRLAEALTREDWAVGKDFYLDAFTDFTPQERAVLSALLGKANSVTVALTCDKLEEDEGGAGIFSPARRTARQLLRLAQERGVSREIEVRAGGAGPKTAALAHLEGQLFAPRPAPYEGAVEELTLLKANSPYSEVEWTAAEILRLVREEGYRFRDIAVCARSLEGCGSLVETIFARYGVPVFLSRMSDILQKPILALITSALEAASGGYRYDDVFRYLKTGLTGLSAEDVDLLENYVLKWSLEGSAWTGARDWANHPRGYGLPFSEGDRALLARLNTLRRQVAQTLEGLRKNPDKTGRGQAAALYAFLEAAGVPERLAQRTEELNRRGQAALAEEYAQLWEILCGGLEQCAQILGDAPMELDEFSKLFALVLSQYDVGSIPVSLDRVNVGDMPRLAHRACPVVFLLGADDGAIPAAAPSPGLLNDDDRSLLASYGLELAPRLSDKLYREMTIVYETCALPQRRFYLSWAAAGPGGTGNSAWTGGRRAAAPPRPARPGAGGAVPPGRGGPARPAGIRPPGGADGAGRPHGAGAAHPPGGGRPLWEAGAHVRLPDGQVQVLPLLLLYAVRPESRAPAGRRVPGPGVRHLRPLCAGARAAGLSGAGWREGGSGGGAARPGPGGGGAVRQRGAGWAGARDRPLPLSVPAAAQIGVRRGGQRGGGAARIPVPAHFLRAGLRRGEGPAPGGAECGRHDGQHLRLRGPGGRLGARWAALSAGRGLQDGAQNL